MPPVAEAELSILIKARDDATRVMNQVTSSMQQFGTKLSGVWSNIQQQTTVFMDKSVSALDKYSDTVIALSNKLGGGIGAIAGKISELDAVITGGVLGQAGLVIGGVAATIATAVGAIALSIDSMLRSFVEQTAALQQTSRQLDVTVEDYQKLGFTAEQTSTSLQGLVQAEKTAARSLAEAGQAGALANRMLTQGLGLTIQQIKQLQQLSPLDQLKALTRILGQFGESANKTAIELKFLGPAYRDVIAALSDN